MESKHGMTVDDEELRSELKRLGNQIFKLLPMWEEGLDWRRTLDTIFIEVVGLSDMLPSQHELLPLVAKLNGLRHTDDLEFWEYRRTIFECCSLMAKIGRAQDVS